MVRYAEIVLHCEMAELSHSFKSALTSVCLSGQIRHCLWAANRLALCRFVMEVNPELLTTDFSSSESMLYFGREYIGDILTFFKKT